MDLTTFKRLFPNATKSTLAANLIGEFVKAPKTEAVKAYAVPRPTTDEEKLNKTERAYLAVLRASQDPCWIGIQNITLKLADDTRLTPDFTTINKLGAITFIDVKGFQREDALIKMKMAARQFTWAQFEIVSRDGREWKIRKLVP